MVYNKISTGYKKYYASDDYYQTYALNILKVNKVQLKHVQPFDKGLKKFHQTQNRKKEDKVTKFAKSLRNT